MTMTGLKMECGSSRYLHSLILGALLLVTCLDVLVCVQCVQDSTAWTFNIPSVSFVSFSPVYTSSQNQRISVSFRTHQPDGLIFSHYLKDLDILELDRINYKLRGELHRGRFVLTYQLKEYRDSLMLGEALNNDNWHSMDVFINSTSGELTLTVDGQSDKTYIRTYIGQDNTNSLNWTELASAIYFGGSDPNTLFANDNYPHMMGCMKEIKYQNKDGGFVPVPLHMFKGVEEGCVDLCATNPCHKGGLCINNITDTICDCFGTDYQGEYCSQLGPTTVTLRGYEWITYSMYQETDDILGLLTETTRLSLEFKTSRGSGVLFYAVGGAPYHSHLTASVHDGIVRVAMGIDDQDVEIDAGLTVNDYRWHNLTIVHYRESLTVYLDNKDYRKVIAGARQLLSLDPKVFIGGGDNFVVTRGLQVTQNFVGCLKNIYVNEVSVLYALSEENANVRYNGAGSTQPQYGCEEVVNIPISFPTSGSNLIITFSDEMKQAFDIEFDFKTVRSDAILFYANLIAEDTSVGYSFGYIEVSIRNGQPNLLFVPSNQNLELSQNYSIPTNVNNNRWYPLQISFTSNQARLKVDGTSVSSQLFEQTLLVRDMVMIGYGLRNYKDSEGFVGCIRNLKVQDEFLDALDLMEDRRAVTGLRIDGCNITDYCQGNKMCEHNGECLSEWEGVACDCSATSYTGRACHFPKYKRSCDEYYQSGVNTSGVMRIDIDGNGDMQPVYVQCEMGYEVNYEFFGKTLVEHNLEDKTKIRGYLMADMRKIISYRGMDREQLIKLTSLSGWCEQYLNYDCRQSPIRLGGLTWFKAANGEMVEYLGAEDTGDCSCSLTDTCINGENCNCDNSSVNLYHDSGYNRIKSQLPLTDITIKQSNVFERQAEANFTLGPLVCWGNINQKRQDAVTFGSEESFLQSHPWKTGFLQISFRSHSEQSLLLYQTGTDLNTNYFLVAVTSASTVKFYFRWGRYKVEFDMSTETPVNNGQWHQIEIDHDPYNIRCMVDMREKILTIPKGVPKVTAFSGPLFIGGTKPGFKRDPLVEMIPGLVGCMRGLVYNNEAKSLNKLRDSSTVDVGEQCMASCWPNPCKNEALCVEEWGSYRCECVNKWAHSGHNCEIDINQDAVTFLGEPDSYLEFKVPPPENLLDSSIVFSFRTFQQSALLLYLHDNLFNFVQVELEEGRRLVAKFNLYQTISNQTKTVIGLNDGKWKQIIINNTDGYIKVIVNVDNEPSRNSYKKQKMTTYSRRPFRGAENVFPKRPRQKPADIMHVFVGGVPYNTSLASLSGCVRGLKIGDKMFPLQQTAKNLDNVVGQCEEGCANQPCKNGGLCLEEFQDSMYQCDCSESEFAGQNCNTEASGHFLGQSILQYQYDPPAYALQSVTEKLELVFQVPAGTKQKMILIFIYSERYYTHDFLIVYLDPKYGVFIQTNQGFAIHGFNKPGQFADGKPHQLLYHRMKSEMVLTVRSEDHPKYRNKTVSLDEEGIGRVTVPDNALDQLDTIMIGGIGAKQFASLRETHDYRDYANFSGCMSDVTFYPAAENPFYLRPLKDLRDNRTNNGVITVLGPIMEICKNRLQGEPTTTQAPPVTWGTVTKRPQLTMPPWNPGPAKTVLTGPSPVLPANKTTAMTTTPGTLVTKGGGQVYESSDPSSKNDKKIMVISLAVVAFLLIIAIIIAVILIRVRRRQHHKEEQKKKMKEAEELELKQPLNEDAIIDNHQNQNYLAKLDEFSMVSVTLGARKTDTMSTFKPPPSEDDYTPVPTSEEPVTYVDQQFYNRKKNRPASSISEVLEEMERQRYTKDTDGNPSNLDSTEGQGHYAAGEKTWDVEPIRSPISCPNEDFRNMPIPENHEDDHDNDADNESDNASPLNEFHHSQEYNGDSGYEAESKPDEEERLINGSFQREIIEPPLQGSQTINAYSEETSPHSLDSKNTLSDGISDLPGYSGSLDTELGPQASSREMALVDDVSNRSATGYISVNGDNT